jgi:hypothetical protein
MRSRTSSPSVWRRRLAGVVAAAAVATGIAVSGPALSASAATTAPTRASSVTNDGLGNVSVTFTVPAGGAYVVGEVSADTQASSGLTATVKEGTTTVPLLVASSYTGTNPAPGYAGAFGTSLSAGSHTWTATLSGSGASTADIWMAAELYTGASGIGATAANHGVTGCANVTLTASANSLVGSVGHDWNFDQTVIKGQPVSGYTPLTVVNQYQETTIHDAAYDEVTNSATTANQVVKMGVSQPCGNQGSTDNWNEVSFEVQGT